MCKNLITDLNKVVNILEIKELSDPKSLECYNDAIEELNDIKRWFNNHINLYLAKKAHVQSIVGQSSSIAFSVNCNANSL
jgi:hypothetical protein